MSSGGVKVSRVFLCERGVFGFSFDVESQTREVSGATPPSTTPTTPLRCSRPVMPEGAPASAARVELASYGIIVDEDSSEALVESLLEVARQKTQTGSCLSSNSKAASVSRNMSVRLMGFGKSATCLGHSPDTYLGTPTETRMLEQALKGRTPVYLACSNRHALLVTDQGQVLAWGEDGSGRLGSGEAVSSALSLTIPRPVAGLQGVVVTKVTCSLHHSLALSSEGDLYSWGSAANGLLGLPAEHVAKLPTDPATNAPYSSRPTKVQGFDGPLTKNRVRDMACGDTFNVACDQGGLSYSWGSAWAGCLGIGDTKVERTSKIVATATPVEALRGQNIVQLAAGLSHVLALADSCNVWTWGSAEFGKLGLGDVSQLPTDNEGLIHAPVPMHLEDLHRKHVVQLAAGVTHSLAVTRDGVVYSWGSSEFGKLGHGPLPDVNTEVMRRSCCW